MWFCDVGRSSRSAWDTPRFSPRCLIQRLYHLHNDPWPVRQTAKLCVSKFFRFIWFVWLKILKPVTLFPPSRPYWLDSPDRHSSCYALPFAPVQPKNINLHPPKWSDYIYHEKVWILWEIHGNSCPASGSQELAFCGWPWKKLSTARLAEP